MTDRVLLAVLLPATGARYEFRISLELSVAEGASLMSRILSVREQARYCVQDSCSLMPLEGEEAGELLDGEATFRQLVARDRLVDGMRVALM